MMSPATGAFSANRSSESRMGFERLYIAMVPMMIAAMAATMISHHSCTNSERLMTICVNAGDIGYTILLSTNRYVNWVRRKLGYDYWSLSAYLKYKVKNAVAHIGKFEESIAHYAAERDADGVICGHIHHPEMREINGILYVNDGDWVESCTALVEHQDGRLELLRWIEPLESRQAAGLDVESLNTRPAALAA